MRAPGTCDEPHGTTWGYFGAATRITVGPDASDGDVAQNWVMAHKLVHVVFPSLQPEHLWLEEGLSTYVGSIARAQAGLVPAAYAWGWFLWGMSHGLPQPGDQGLDRTHRWGRTFWEALCFALSRIWTFVRAPKIGAILTAGGNGETRWLLAQVLDVADRATGVPVFGELYQTMKDRPVDIDLTGLWSRLGVSLANEQTSFDDSAPLASIRRAITAPPAARLPGDNDPDSSSVRFHTASHRAKEKQQPVIRPLCARADHAAVK